MRRKPFTDSELRAASISVMNAMWRSFPDLSEYEAVFSDEFNAKMDALFHKVKVRRQITSISKRIAAVFAAMLIGLTSWIAVDTDARAAFFDWIREVYANSVVYKYFGEKEQAVLPEYELTWLPDGFEAFLSEADEIGSISFYLNPETGDGIGFEYRYLDEGSQLKVLANANTKTEVVQVGDISAQFYHADESSETNNLIWIDPKMKIIFMLNSNLEKEVILTITDNIKLVNSTK